MDHRRLVYFILPLLAVSFLWLSTAIADGDKDKGDRAKNLAEEMARRENIKKEMRAIMAVEYFKTGKRLYEENRLQEARDQLEQAVSMNPDLEEAKELLAKVRGELGVSVDESSELIRTMTDARLVALREQQVIMENGVNEARSQMESKNYAGAVAKLEALLKAIALNDYPENLAPYKNTIETALNEARAKMAQQKVQNIEDESAAAAVKATAEARIRKALQESQVTKLLARAQGFVQVELYEKAISAAEDTLVLDPENQLALSIIESSRVAKHEKLIEETDAEMLKEKRESLLIGEKLLIPRDELIVYPLTWEEISKRRRPFVVQETEKSSSEVRIERRLEREIEINFVDEPFMEVIEFIRRITELSIVVDKNALLDLPEGSSTPVTLKVKGVSIARAFDWILKPYELAYEIRDEAVYITSRVDIPAALYSYNVEDLTGAVLIQDHPGPRVEFGSIDLEGGTFEMEEAEDVGGEDRLSLGGDEIVELIRDVVAPDTWEEESYSIRYNRGSIFVRHTPAVNEKIVKLLAGFRALLAIQVSIEARLITVTDNFMERIGVDFLPSQSVNGNSVDFYTHSRKDAARGLPPKSVEFFGDINTSVPSLASADPDMVELTSSGSGLELLSSMLSPLDMELFVRAVHMSAEASLVQAPRVTMFNRQLAFMSVNEFTKYIRDTNPEVSANAVAFNPEIGTFPEGIIFEVRPTVSSDRKYVLLDVTPTIISLTELSLITLDGGFFITSGDNPQTIPVTTVIQLPRYKMTKMETSVIVPDRGTLLIGGMKDLAHRQLARGVPFFDRVPIMKMFFSNRGEVREQETLLILITPYILIREEEESKL